MVQMFHVAKTRPLLPNKSLQCCHNALAKRAPMHACSQQGTTRNGNNNDINNQTRKKKLFPGGTLCLMPPSIDVLGRQFCDNSVPVALRRSWLRASPTSIVGHSGELPQPGRQRQPDASPVQLHMFHQHARAGSEAAKRHGIQSNIFRALFN